MNIQKAKVWFVFSAVVAALFCLYACSTIALFKSEEETRIGELSYKLGLLYVKDSPEKACVAYTFCKQFEMAYREDYRVFMDAALTHLKESQLGNETRAVLNELLKELKIENRRDIYTKELHYPLLITMAERAGNGIIDGITTSVCRMPE